MDIAQWAVSHLPFAALLTQAPPHNRPLLTRLTEQAFVGIVAAGFGIYGNNIKQQGQIENLNDRVAAMRQEQSASIASIRQDQKEGMVILQQNQKESLSALNSKVDEMRRDFYVPREAKKQ